MRLRLNKVTYGARVIGLLASAVVLSAVVAYVWVGYQNDDPLSRAAFVVAFIFAFGPALAVSALVAALWARSRGAARRDAD